MCFFPFGAPQPQATPNRLLINYSKLQLLKRDDKIAAQEILETIAQNYSNANIVIVNIGSVFHIWKTMCDTIQRD